jgi:hypothetical protein
MRSVRSSSSGRSASSSSRDTVGWPVSLLRVDPGAPLSASKAVSQEGVDDGPAAGPVAGYTLLRAADLGKAVQLVENHPFIARGGTLQVSEAVDLGA